jgi:hypothetical protein
MEGLHAMLTNEAAAFNGTKCYINAVQDRNNGRKNQEIKALMVPVVIINSDAKNGGYLFQVRQYEEQTWKQEDGDHYGSMPFGGAAFYSSGSLWAREDDGRFIPLIDDITDQGSITVHTGNDGLPVFTRIYPEFLEPSEMGPVVQDKNGRFSQSAVVVNDEAAIAKGKARKAREKAAKTSKTS